jgi:hypothetical protein
MAEAEIVREGFDATETHALVETATSAVAAQAQAQVQARYIMAMQRPRDWDKVRVQLLKDCRRSSFAEVAIYHKPVGDGVQGPSIRFAEAALRAMTNIMPDVSTIYDDAQKRIVRVSVTDLEANLTYSKDVVIQKTIERRNHPQGVVPIGIRYNTKGQKLYILEATDDDILNRENALISKAIRTSGLRLLPGDILDECMTQVRATREAGVKADPDAARKKIVDSFASIGVPPDQLKAYLGHDLGTASPAELEQLRGLYAAIKDGEATWAEAMDSRAPASTEEEEKKRGEVAASLRDKLAARRKPPAAGSAPAAPAAASKPAAPAAQLSIGDAIRDRLQGTALGREAETRVAQQIEDALRTEFGEDLSALDEAKTQRALELIRGWRIEVGGK